MRIGIINQSAGSPCAPIVLLIPGIMERYQLVSTF
jgi:hypothetical protein